jgi:integrase
VQLRDRALVAFILLTGTRDRAVASLKLKHVDLAAGRVGHDATEGETKNSKTSVTFFFPVDPGIRGIVSDWIEHLRTEKLWGNDDPLFPATKVCQDDTRKFAASGLDRTQWSTAGPIRKVFHEAFARANLPYFNPHSLRSTLARLGEQRCKTPEQFKAWSQNLGHEQVLTTFRSYGHVSIERQGHLIEGLRHGQGPELERDEIARQLETIQAEIKGLKASSRSQSS